MERIPAGKFDQRYAWFATDAGRELRRREWLVLKDVLPTLHGVELLWLGIEPPLGKCGTHHREVIGVLAGAARQEPGDDCPRIACRFDPQALPVTRARFDVVVMQHVLDCARDPHSALREAAAAVRVGGALVVVGFNPWSLWGLRRLFSPRRQLPWSATFLGPLRLLDWLSLLGFNLERSVYEYYRAPWNRIGGLFSRPRLQAIKQRLNAPLGGVYVFVARKTGTGANMMRAEWRTVRPTPVMITEAARNAAAVRQGHAPTHPAIDRRTHPEPRS